METIENNKNEISKILRYCRHNIATDRNIYQKNGSLGCINHHIIMSVPHGEIRVRLDVLKKLLYEEIVEYYIDRYDDNPKETVNVCYYLTLRELECLMKDVTKEFTDTRDGTMDINRYLWFIDQYKEAIIQLSKDGNIC